MKRLIVFLAVALAAGCTSVKGTRVLAGPKMVTSCVPTTFVSGLRIFTITAGCDTVASGSLIPPAPQGEGD